MSLTAQSARTIEYTDCISAERKAPSTNNTECPGYNTKKSDGEAPVMLELWGIRSTLSLPSFPGLLLPGVVLPERALFMGYI